MISLRNSLKLAVTKLKVKRGLTVSAIIVNSLLFTVLVVVAVGFIGARASLEKIISQAGGDSYLVSIQPNFPASSIVSKYTGTPSTDVIDEIRRYEAAYQQEQTEKYAALGLEYDPDSEISALRPVGYLSQTIPEQYRVEVNPASPVITELKNQAWRDWAETATNKTDSMLSLAKKYGATNFYKTATSDYDSDRSHETLNSSNAQVLANNQEDMSKWLDSEYSDNGLSNNSYTSMDDGAVNEYITYDGKLSGIPVVVSAYDIAELFGDQLGVSTKAPESDKDKATWLSDVQEKASGFTYEVCYRNSAERNLLYQAQQTANEIELNKDNPNYTMPDLIYGFPTDPCGDIPVLSDTRTQTEKNTAIAANETAKKLGTYTTPRHQLVKFQVVGVVNQDFAIGSTQTSERSTNLSSYFSNLLSGGANLGNFASGGIIPSSLYDSLLNELKFQGDVTTDSGADLPADISNQFASGILEFSSLEQAREFLDNETCPYFSSDCTKQYYADQYGVNYLAMNDFNDLFGKAMIISIPIIAGLAIVIMWFTISRIMADSRYETAIYRAIGARRGDIRRIYLVYVTILALIIGLVTVGLGFVTLLIVNNCFSGAITAALQSALSLTGQDVAFNFLAMSGQTATMCGLIVLLIIVACWLSSITPIIRNTLRQPIDDLRSQ